MNTNPILTRKQLDAAVQGGCQEPGCTEPHDGHKLYLHARCHMNENPEVEYHVGGVLIIKCAVCEQLVVRIKVAE